MSFPSQEYRLCCLRNLGHSLSMSSSIDPDTYFMQKALTLAVEASDAGEVPIGAVLVHDGKIIGQACNQTQTLKDPTAHAEILVLTQGAAALGDWRLNGTTLYVTKEPCPMCAGALVLARVDRVIWGVSDPIRGGQSHFGILNSPVLNHRPEVVEDALEEESRDLLQDFFKARRAGPDE